MQQVREAENASLVGLPENIISALNKYVNIGITHFIMDFVGLSENTIKIFHSKVIKKLWNELDFQYAIYYTFYNNEQTIKMMNVKLKQ